MADNSLQKQQKQPACHAATDTARWLGAFMNAPEQ
jgi:hypothetical protein